VVEGTIGGYLPPDGFSQEMSAIAKTHFEFPAAEAKFKAHPADSSLAAKMAGLYAGKGKRIRRKRLLWLRKTAHRIRRGWLKAYNAVGDHFQGVGQYDKAIPLFKKGAKMGKDPGDIAYSNMSIAACYFSQENAKTPFLYRGHNQPSELSAGYVGTSATECLLQLRMAAEQKSEGGQPGCPPSHQQMSQAIFAPADQK